jgi:hypothetical protein
MHRTRTLVAGLVGAGLLIATPTVATAGGSTPPKPHVKSTALAAPFNLSVRGDVLVADGALNLVGKLKHDGSIKTIAAHQPGASGVAVSGSRLAFTTTVSNPETFENSASGLNIWAARGKRIYADTHAYEARKNPDQVNTYGVVGYPAGADKKCIDGVFGGLTGGEATYKGQVDSHAYSVAAYGKGWVVADAGANALFRVNNSGRIHTLAVLPPQPLVVSGEQAAALELPDCVIGVTYAFEPVPTDVEVGRDGFLYVTTLPGGPESPVLGARGKVWKVNPRTGTARPIASGFLGATNLALGSKGEIYVSELFAGQISVIQHGRTKVFASLPGVVAVETGNGAVWAATLGNEDPPAPGTIVKFGKSGHATKVGIVRR